MYDTVVFIDNGSSGSIGVFSKKENKFFLTPVIKQQDYTKKKKTISRLDVTSFSQFLNGLDNKSTMIFFERPMINSGRFNTSIVASRVFEAELIIVELFEFPYQIIDSKEWQSDLLPSSRKRGTTSDVLKKESHDIGLRLFPLHAQLINKHKDADGILGAYAMYGDLAKRGLIN